MSSPAVEDHAPVRNRGPAVLAVTTATLALASVFVGARMVCRYFIVRRVSWDDRVMMVAWLIAFFLSFSICYGATVGLGKHDDDISDADLPKLRRFEYVFSILYNPALMATKTAILIFYLRLAKNTQVVLRYASWATLAVVNIAGIVLTFMNIFQCNPVAAAWTIETDSPSRCIPLLTEFICAAPVNIVTDLAILALPIPVLTGMRLPSRQKTILVITFTLGIFVTIVDVVRIYYLQKAISDVPTGLTSDPGSRFGGHQDFAWNASLSFMWSAVEVNVAMACACIPTLKPLILKLLPAMLHDPDGTRVSRTTKSNSDHEIPPSRRLGSVTRESMATPESGTGSNPSGTKSDSSNEAPMTAMEFLTTPDMRNLSERTHPDLTATRAQTNVTASTSSVVNGVYFGFVNMTKPKSMLRANASESFKYCTIVAILFFLWGLSYGLLNTLNNAIAVVNQMSTAQTLGLTSAYFGVGYFFGPLLVGEWILRRDEHNRSKRHERNEAENVGGYKVTFIVGLCIYGIGTIIFWPSAVTNSFGGFMLSNFVVGFGLSVLEVAANSFMILCGPPEYGETRLLLAQAVQAVGSVVSGLLAQKVFFTGISQDSLSDSNSMTLINVQWTYLGITLLCVVLGLFFFYMPLPEVSDSELEFAANKLPIDTTKRSIGGLQLRTVSLVLAVFAQYMYVAGQESNSIYFRSLLLSILPNPPNGADAVSGTTTSGSTSDPDKAPGMALSIPDYLLVAHSIFAASRFLAGCLAYFSVSNRRLPQPRTVLTSCILSCFLLALLLVVLRPPQPELLVIPALLFYFAEGPIWPLLFAIGLRGQGRRTKRAAAFITMGGSGPAFFPFIMYAIIDNGGSVKTAYIIIVALQVAMVAYPIFLQFSRDAKQLVDPNPDVRAALEQHWEARSTDEVVNSQQNYGANSFFAMISQQLKRGERRKSSLPQVQHNEAVAS
ncbi:L-fucose permease [Metarhizium album ARSEF 1941]|uniref:L-fucose permease n=1 Tax=Metarhizium album (strain ARSEF 1941) TaxID=1081103 RepID=A0A0B2WDQ6_METAS|nr:L-fucose permease [Metarhizium album ARSEF 1941]KHN94011.1 L-fucose permease [Metarhizium album ARSEF 1941]